MNPAVSTSRKDYFAYQKLQDTSAKRRKKHQKELFDELIELMGNPDQAQTAKTDNFYDKFKNIDKIIEREENDKTLETMQDLAEQQEQEVEKRRQKVLLSSRKLDEIMKIKRDGKSPDHDINASGFSSSPSVSPGRVQQPPTTDMGKSPIVEYLKQVNKDKLLPHFIPFKQLKETATPG